MGKSDIKVTVLISTLNSEKYIKEAVDSVLEQDFKDWDMLVINEFGSDDATAEIIGKYEEQDSRIHLIQNDKKLGLAESLNLGLRLAKGEYIARLDADDIALPSRFGKQVAYMEEHKDVVICGSWQQHFGTERWIHKPPADTNLCHAFLLFNCHLCHSTIMMRKDFFLKNNLFYDGRYLAEDYELWTRVMGIGEIANIPEVLGLYRHGSQNITEIKRKRLNRESGHIVAVSLKRYLRLELPVDSHYLLNTWTNLYTARIFKRKRLALLPLEAILKQVWESNQQVHFFDENALLIALHSKWRWAKYGLDWKEAIPVKTIEDVFSLSYRGAFWKNLRQFLSNNKSLSKSLMKIIKRLTNA